MTPTCGHVRRLEEIRLELSNWAPSSQTPTDEIQQLRDENGQMREVLDQAYEARGSLFPSLGKNAAMPIVASRHSLAPDQHRTLVPRPQFGFVLKSRGVEVEAVARISSRIVVDVVGTHPANRAGLARLTCSPFRHMQQGDERRAHGPSSPPSLRFGPGAPRAIWPLSSP